MNLRELYETILGVPVGGTGDRWPVLASGEALTDAQARAVRPIVDDGPPEWSGDAGYAAAVEWERRRRNRAAMSVDDADRAIMGALLDVRDYLRALDDGGDTAEHRAALDQRLAAAQVVRANDAAAQAVAALAGEARPADYPALVAAFDAELSAS